MDTLSPQSQIERFMEDFVGKWVQITDSRKNFDGMYKYLNVPPHVAEKFNLPYSVEYTKDGDTLSAHYSVEKLGEKTYKLQPGVERITDGMDGKKYKATLEIMDKVMKDTSIAIDGGPQIITERTLEGKDSMVVKIFAGDVESEYRMCRVGC